MLGGCEAGAISRRKISFITGFMVRLPSAQLQRMV